MNNVVCVACESGDIEVHAFLEELRPNGENMELYECRDCGQCWKE